MERAQVVIGAGFGDEGKGLMTDFLASRHGPGAIVVRFNGGAQAGHTVTTPAGERHVFSHFASGSFVGAATFLSGYYVSNPILFVREREALKRIGVRPVVYADPRGAVTTPYDMMINQAVEQARGSGRHGSCGLGFGETLERNLRQEFAVTVADLADEDRLRDKLKAIRRGYVLERFQALRYPELFDEYAELLMADAILDKYVEEALAFRDAVTVTQLDHLAHERPVIFEGAQGLLLDQDRGAFPFVTRSNTGVKNVLAVASEAGIGALDVTYVTRAYSTRHGAGPMPSELPGLPYPDVRDETNVPNLFQGSLRFGWLSADVLRDAVSADLSDARGGTIAVRAGVALTCVDQLPSTAVLVRGGRDEKLPKQVLAEELEGAVELPVSHISHGPSRKTVVENRPALFCHGSESVSA